MKKAIVISLLAIVAVLGFVNNGQTSFRSYYSGDAVSFNNQLYVGSTNSESLEVFKLGSNGLKRLVSVRPFNQQYGQYGSFYDFKFSVENGRLFIYAISNYTLYKYELLQDSELSLINVQANTYWEWYTRVDRFGDNIITASDKGVKIWNTNLVVLDSYSFTNTVSPYNLAGNSRFLFSTSGGYLTVFDRESRSITKTIAINTKFDPANRRTYQDENNNIYIVDDYYAKKFDLDGKLLASFKHLDYQGFDVAASGYTNYLYFSNGVGVVKLNKDNMKLVASRWTDKLGGAQGWAMGLRVVNANGEKVVVFNNSNILVLDERLNKLGSFQATTENEPTAVENLFLNLDHNLGAAGASITLSGGGFFPNETLNIDFAGTKSTAQADYHGRFTKALTIPSQKPGSVDIKVDGQTSCLSYSIAFKIQ